MGIGGVTATQEVMDLCAKHDIMPDLEIVAATDMHRVYQALDDGNDSGRRYVLDAATIEKAAVRNFRTAAETRRAEEENVGD